jgi:hypothetical protein
LGFFSDIILPVALWRRGNPAYSRNGYQDYLLG